MLKVVHTVGLGVGFGLYHSSFLLFEAIFRKMTIPIVEELYPGFQSLKVDAALKWVMS